MPRLFYDQTIKNCDNFDNGDADDDEENDGFWELETNSVGIARSADHWFYSDRNQ